MSYKSPGSRIIQKWRRGAGQFLVGAVREPPSKTFEISVWWKWLLMGLPGRFANRPYEETTVLNLVHFHGATMAFVSGSAAWPSSGMPQAAASVFRIE